MTKKKARYHRVILRTGHILEIGWHFGKKMFMVSHYHPDNNNSDERWHYNTEHFDSTVKGALGKARLAIAKEMNPDIAAVETRIRQPQMIPWDSGGAGGAGGSGAMEITYIYNAGPYLGCNGSGGSSGGNGGNGGFIR